MVSRLNKRVLACRPAEQNAHWRQKLEQGGYVVLDIPLLEIVGLTDAKAVQRIKKRIVELDTYNGVIFVSTNAVALAFKWIEDYWPQLPIGICFHAVGKKTAELIDRCVTRMTGFPPGKTHYVNDGAMDSEALLAQLMQHTQHTELNQKKFLICRGTGGRPLLGDELVRHGARVDYCELYQRYLPAAALEKIQRAGFDPARDLLAVFSGETLDNLVTVFKQAEISGWWGIPIVVPGQRVAEKARTYGFKQIIVAANATEDAMFDALTKITSETAK